VRISADQKSWRPPILGGLSALLLLSAFVLVPRECAAQTTDQSNDDQARDAQRRAACDWRFVPQPLPPDPTDPQEKALLDKRGHASDLGNPYGGPLDQPQHSQSGGGQGSSTGIRSEIPYVPGRPVVVATFKSFQTYLSSSHRSIYTVGKLDVEQVLDPGDQGVTAGQLIDLGMRGGAVQLSDGRVLRYGVDPDEDYCIEPGHRYLFILDFDDDSAEFGYRKIWELKEGLAVSYSPDDVDRVREGKSVLAGLTEAELLDAIRQTIEQRKSRTNQR
jgi:hypothetical protein